MAEDKLTETKVLIHRQSLKLMGNRFEFSVVSDDAGWAAEKIGLAIAEVKRIEQLLTTFDPSSQTNQINNMAGIAPVKVNREVLDLIARSLKISKLTQGAFDISYGSIDKKLWNFDRTMTALPDRLTARQMVCLINYRNVILDEKRCTVFLKERGMRIGFGGIGKGYAAEQAKKILLQQGVTSGIVNASGDLAAWGTQPDGQPWTIGIADPDAAGQPFSYLNITDMSVATSGNYEKFVMIGGKKYSHTIDPKTGLPVTGIKSVTIISPDAEISDAMATPVTVMGIKAGLDMINQINGIGCVIIDDDNRVYTSKNIHLQ
ncbi:MAG: FAD:protein FMN transferase [Chitinophagaceae bacterium]|nr:FAD:protein FMN transferase [Chitinophagaceae bacterium]